MVKDRFLWCDAVLSTMRDLKALFEEQVGLRLAVDAHMAQRSAEILLIAQTCT